MAIKTASTLKAIDCGTIDKRAIEVNINRSPEGSVMKKKIVRPKNENAEEKARRSKAVENNFEKLFSSRAMSRVKTLFIPKSAKRDINPKIDKAAE